MATCFTMVPVPYSTYQRYVNIIKKATTTSKQRFYNFFLFRWSNPVHNHQVGRAVLKALCSPMTKSWRTTTRWAQNNYQQDSTNRKWNSGQNLQWCKHGIPGTTSSIGPQTCFTGYLVALSEKGQLSHSIWWKIK
jgi:hypothetical protein